VRAVERRVFRRRPPHFGPHDGERIIEIQDFNS
jgi:hypothetical protein